MALKDWIHLIAFELHQSRTHLPEALYIHPWPLWPFQHGHLPFEWCVFSSFIVGELIASFGYCDWSSVPQSSCLYSNRLRSKSTEKGGQKHSIRNTRRSHRPLFYDVNILSNVITMRLLDSLTVLLRFHVRILGHYDEKDDLHNTD